MITREQKINAIYEKIANKDLTFGCKIFHKVESGKRGFKARIITDSIKREQSDECIDFIYSLISK